MRRRPTGVAALLAAVAVVALAVPASAARPPAVSLTPTSLPRGANPALPWYDPVAGDLHDGSRTLHLGLRRVTALTEAGRGYLLLTGAGTLVHVGATGAVRTVARRTDGLGPVSPDGRTTAFTRGRGAGSTLVVARTSDGRVLHRRVVGDPGVASVLALTAHRVLFTTYRHTAWWTFGRRGLTTVGHGQAAAVSVRGRRVAASPSGSETGPWVVSRLRRGGPTWRLTTHHTPRAFSPSGRLLVVGRTRGLDPRGYDVVDGPLRIATAATGAPVLDVRGVFGYGAWGYARWESDTSVLVPLRAADAAPDGTLTMVWARCTTTGSCSAASPVFRWNPDDADGNPASSPAWVVAAQPAA